MRMAAWPGSERRPLVAGAMARQPSPTRRGASRGRQSRGRLLLFSYCDSELDVAQRHRPSRSCAKPQLRGTARGGKVRAVRWLVGLITRNVSFGLTCSPDRLAVPAAAVAELRILVGYFLRRGICDESARQHPRLHWRTARSTGRCSHTVLLGASTLSTPSAMHRSDAAGRSGVDPVRRALS